MKQSPARVSLLTAVLIGIMAAACTAPNDPGVDAIDESVVVSDPNSAMAPWQDNSMALVVSSSTSIPALVSGSRAILIGTVIAYSGTVVYGGATPTPLPTTGVAGLDVPLEVPTMAKYGFLVTDILYNEVEATFPITVGQTVEMWTYSGEPAIDQSALPPDVGQDYLFFGYADDEAQFGAQVISPISRSTIGLVHSDNPLGPVEWAGGVSVDWASSMTYADFEADVIAEIASQHP